jgi:hypothetical protein
VLDIRPTDDEQLHFSEQAVYVTPASVAATATCEELGTYASSRPQPIR